MYMYVCKNKCMQYSCSFISTGTTIVCLCVCVCVSVCVHCCSLGTFFLVVGGSGFTPKNWRKRWFVLKDGKLYYYKTSFVSRSCLCLCVCVCVHVFCVKEMGVHVSILSVLPKGCLMFLHSSRVGLYFSDPLPGYFSARDCCGVGLFRRSSSGNEEEKVRQQFFLCMCVCVY